MLSSDLAQAAARSLKRNKDLLEKAEADFVICQKNKFTHAAAALKRSIERYKSAIISSQSILAEIAKK